MNMKRNLKQWTLNLVGATLFASILMAADAPQRYVSQPGCKVSIDGDSTIHAWTVEGAIIGGYFEVEPGFANDKLLKSVPSLTTKEANPMVEVTIPVRSLKSGKDKMDEIMQEAMREKDFRTIRYKLKEMVVKPPIPDSGTPVTFATKGDLMVAGVTNTIDMEVVLERLEGGKVKFTGKKQLKMTSFNIQPPAPKLALGLIKTEDDVTVKFEWIVAPKKAAPAATK